MVNLIDAPFSLEAREGLFFYPPPSFFLAILWSFILAPNTLQRLPVDGSDYQK
jgi:hypothetical protein